MGFQGLDSCSRNSASGVGPKCRLPTEMISRRSSWSSPEVALRIMGGRNPRREGSSSLGWRECRPEEPHAARWHLFQVPHELLTPKVDLEEGWAVVNSVFLEPLQDHEGKLWAQASMLGKVVQGVGQNLVRLLPEKGSEGGKGSLVAHIIDQ